MYLKIEDLTNDELQVLKETFGDRLRSFFSIYYEVSKEEISCAIDNLEDEKLKQVILNNGDTIDYLIDVYQNNKDYQWDTLYDAAREVLENELDSLREEFEEEINAI